MKKSMVLVAMVIGAACLAAAGLDEQEERVSIEQLPAAVKATILREAGAGTIAEIERTTAGGKEFYEAEVVIAGVEYEIQVAADGSLLGKKAEGKADGDGENEEQEDVIAIGQVPPAAFATLMQYVGKSEITKVERERSGGATLYEASWSSNGVQHEAEVTEEGALVELTEIVAAPNVPAAVIAAATARFPAGTVIVYEKKTYIAYELKAVIDGKEKEILALPTGRVHANGDSDGDDNDSEDDSDDDDDDDSEEDDDSDDEGKDD